MNTSVFDVAGPVMIGPSSSHTAGAARLARTARLIAAKPFSRVAFGLHGSFAKTYKGHGTDCALVAGVLGFAEDDERLADAFAIAEEQGLEYEFYEADLTGMHENSVQVTFYHDDGEKSIITGSSVGGAQIVIKKINSFSVDFTAQSSTIIIQQEDRKGLVSEVSRVMAEHGINIGVMKLSRKAKGDTAFCVIETDSRIPDSAVRQIQSLPHIIEVCAINLETGEDSQHV